MNCVDRVKTTCSIQICNVADHFILLKVYYDKPKSSLEATKHAFILDEMTQDVPLYQFETLKHCFALNKDVYSCCIEQIQYCRG